MNYIIFKLSQDSRLLLVTIMFFYYASMGILIPYLPLLLSHSVEAHQIGILMAIGALMMIIMQPLWGTISDHYGIRIVLLITISGTSLSTLGFFVAKSFSEWVFVLIIYFLFQSPIGTLVDTMAISKFTSQFGSIRLWGSIGFGTFVFIGGFFVGDITYILHIFLLIISLLLSIILIDPKLIKGERKSIKRFMVILKNGQLILIIILLFFTSVSMKGNGTFYSIGLTLLDVPSWLLGTAWLLQVFPEIVVFLFVDHLAKRVSSWNLVIFGMIIFAIQFSILGYFQNLWVWTLSQPLVSLGFCFWYSGSIRLIKNMVPNEFQATGQTLFSAVYNGVGGVVGSSFSGLIVSKWSVFGFYTVAGILCAIAAFFFWVVTRTGIRNRHQVPEIVDRNIETKRKHTN